jgi:hypothetical protein
VQGESRFTKRAVCEVAEGAAGWPTGLAVDHHIGAAAEDLAEGDLDLLGAVVGLFDGPEAGKDEVKVDVYGLE